uniref:Hexosyltransferase n=1 Tax=Parascaris univalens TaxID=6257 RepID=A0A915BV23_PARUN
MLFFVGISADGGVNSRIDDESFTHRDIIQQNFLDVYWNMTWKALAWLRFVDEYCKTPQYVLKIDDDVVFDLYALIKYLRVHVEDSPRTDPENLFICGLLDGQGLAPSRDPSFKWCVTKEEYEFDYYHPYCFGMQYITSPRIAKKVLNASVGEKYFWIDDYFITGHLGHKVNASYHKTRPLRGSKGGLLNGTALFWLIEKGDMNEGKEIWQKICERNEPGQGSTATFGKVLSIG